MSLIGLPVMVASALHFRGKGFTIDSRSSTEYEDALHSLTIGTRLSREQISEAEPPTLYVFSSQLQIPFPFFEEFPKSGVIQRAHLVSEQFQLMSNLETWLEAFEGEKPFMLPRRHLA